MNSTQVKQFTVASTGELPLKYQCCQCDLYDGHGELEVHIPQFTLYYCQNPECDHLVCKDHLAPCGFCAGCCFENHGYEHKEINQ